MHCRTALRSVIDARWPVKGEAVRSRPTTSQPVFRSVRTSASPRCPALPVTSTRTGPLRSHSFPAAWVAHDELPGAVGLATQHLDRLVPDLGCRSRRIDYRALEV